MKYIGDLADPFSNSSNHWILIISISLMPDAGDSASGSLTTGNLLDGNGNRITSFATAIWDTYTTSTNTVGFSNTFLCKPMLVPPGYTFENFAHCQAFQLDFEEVGGFT